MTDLRARLPRRLLLKTAAALAITPASLASAVADTPPSGRPGDFDFLAGNWKIHNRRPKAPGSSEWIEFPGEATCWSILGGVGSVEELRIPVRSFAGMGLRLLDVDKKMWSDFWVNAKSGVLTTPGQTGTFANGVGTFSAEDMDGEKPIKIRGVWDRITPTSCRWYQGVSYDGGKSWIDDWFMDWTRV